MKNRTVPRRKNRMDPARSDLGSKSFSFAVFASSSNFSLVKHKIFSFPRNVPQDIRNHRIKVGCRLQHPGFEKLLTGQPGLCTHYDILYILDMFKNLIICHCINFKKHRVGKPLGNALYLRESCHRVLLTRQLSSRQYLFSRGSGSGF